MKTNYTPAPNAHELELQEANNRKRLREFDFTVRSENLKTALQTKEITKEEYTEWVRDILKARMEVKEDTDFILWLS